MKAKVFGLIRIKFLVVLCLQFYSFFGHCQWGAYFPYGLKEVCPGQEIDYSPGWFQNVPVVDSYCANPISYSWSVSGGQIVVDGGEYIRVVWDNSPGTKTVTLNTTYQIPYREPPQLACVDAGSTIFDSQSIAVELLSTPVNPANLSLSSSSLCSGQSITITSDAPEAITNRVWIYTVDSGPGIVIETNTLASINFIVPQLMPGASVIFSVYATNAYCEVLRSASSFSGPAIVKSSAPVTDLIDFDRICTTSGGVRINSITTSAALVKISLRNIQTTAVINETMPPSYFTGKAYNLTDGNYELIVENDPAGCFTETKTFSITEIQAENSLVVTPSPVAAQCYNGTANLPLSVSGANGNVVFALDNNLPASYVYGSTINAVSAGAHTVYALDEKGCKGQALASVGNPSDIIIAGVAVTSGTLPNHNGKDVTCFNANDGQITITATDGTGDLDYSIDGGTTFLEGNVFSALAPGSYPNIKVRDDNSCVKEYTGSPIVINNVPVLIAGTASSTNPTCNGYNGKIDISNTSGGNGAYMYSVGSGFLSGPTLNVPAGSYTVQVRDANQCTTSISALQVLTDPAQITVSATTTKVSCLAGSDGTITATALNTVGTVQYSLDGGTTYQPGNLFTNKTISSVYRVTVKDGNSCTAQSGFIVVDQVPTLIGSVTQTANILCYGDTGVRGAVLDLTPSGGTPDAGTYVYDWTKAGATIATTQDVSGIPAGTYSVTITDKKLCSTTLPNIVVSQPALLTSSISKTDVSCNPAHGVALSSNGAINLTPAGGTTPYQYAWSSNNVSQDLSGLVAGTYSVTITDNNGCIANNTATLLQPAAVVSSVGLSSDVTCKGLNNGSITITATGGTSVFSYSKDGTSWQASPVFSSLPPTGYTVITKDQNGCTSQLTQAIAEPNALVAAISDIVNTTCGNSNGSAQVNVTGGNGNYQYAWKNTFNQTVSTASVLSNASGDAYTVTVTDSKNCSDSKAALISNSDGAIITISSIDPTTCYDSHDGKAVITVSSGMAPYAITWSNAETGLTPAALLPGDNIVRVSDANNCVAVKLVAVPFPDAIAIDTKIITPPTCFGSTDAAIALTMKGGNGIYSYAWSNGPITSSITNVAAGDYGLTVKDSKNCTYTSSIKIDAIPELKLSVINEKLPTCFDGSDGALTVGTTGGNGTYSYQWTDGPAASQIENIKAGAYVVKVTDVKGCNLSSSFTLNNPVRFTISIDDKTICVGQKYKIASDVTNGSYSWTSTKGFSSAQREVTLTDPDIYTLKVVDAQGCTAQDSFELKTSTDLLHADLLMISEAYQADTVVVIDLSWPLPDAVTWLFPTQASVVEQNNDLGYAFLKFNKTGQYDVAIRANLGECVDTYSQAILIKEGGVTNSGGRQSTINVIQYFEVHPNPNKGDFRILAELSEAQPVKLMLVNAVGNKILINQYDEGKDNYSWDFSIPDLTQGTYFLVLKAGKETKAIRMMKL